MGWQRFGILLLCCFFVMVLFPDYDKSAWATVGMMALMWTGAIMLISLICNVFALDRFDWINRLITLIVFGAIVYTLLWYFPQSDKVSPINKLKYGEYPTIEQMKKGIEKLKFHNDFVHQNKKRTESFSEEEADQAKDKLQQAAQAVKEGTESFIEIVDEETGSVFQD